MSTDDHWQEAIPDGTEAMCVAADPTADFRWHALPCGGPQTAAFICELSGMENERIIPLIFLQFQNKIRYQEQIANHERERSPRQNPPTRLFLFGFRIKQKTVRL